MIGHRQRGWGPALVVCGVAGLPAAALADAGDIPGQPPADVVIEAPTTAPRQVETPSGDRVRVLPAQNDVTEPEPEGEVPVVSDETDDDEDDIVDAGVFEVRASNKTIEGIYITDTDFMGREDVSRRLGLLLTEDRDIVGSYGLMIPGTLGDLVPGPIAFSVGMTGYLGLLDDEADAFGIGPTARLAIALPFETPMAVVGSATYAPDILTIGDADNIVDLDARYEVQLLPRVVGFAGLHLLRFELDDAGDDEIASNLQVGARFAF